MNEKNLEEKGNISKKSTKNKIGRLMHLVDQITIICLTFNF